MTFSRKYKLGYMASFFHDSARSINSTNSSYVHRWPVTPVYRTEGIRGVACPKTEGWAYSVLQPLLQPLPSLLPRHLHRRTGQNYPDFATLLLHHDLSIHQDVSPGRFALRRFRTAPMSFNGPKISLPHERANVGHRRFWRPARSHPVADVPRCRRATVLAHITSL